MVHSDARRQDADHALHGVFMIAVADIQIVMDVVVGDREIACAIVNAVVAKMVDLVVREQELGWPKAQRRPSHC